MSDTRRPLLLTERTPRLCRLAPADVAFLIEHHHSHLELLPTGQRHRYRVTPAGVAGVIVAPTRRLVIRPKIPLRNLFHLLDPLAPLPAQRDHAAGIDGSAVIDFLAGQLARQLAERASAGLHRGYSQRDHHGTTLLGALDLSAQLREAPGRKDQLHSRHDDLTADLPCNQAPRAAGEALASSPLVGEPVRLALRQALAGFAEVAPTLPPDLPGLIQRAPPGYRTLLELSRLVLDALAPGVNAGALPAPAFLLEMERVFERYLSRGLVEAFADRPGAALSVQVAHRVGEPAPAQPDLHMRPDLTIDRAARPVHVVDAKWKRLPATAVINDDLYQVLAYAAALGAVQATLVYPGRRERVWSYTFPHASIQVTIRTLDVAGTPEACARALRQLARALGA
jgi:5-methylcytosine-specific restriction enzyme subunit McrC